MREKYNVKRERELKSIDRILETVKRAGDERTDKICINEMQFGFMPGCKTTDAIFVLRHYSKIAELTRNIVTLCLQN